MKQPPPPPLLLLLLLPALAALVICRWCPLTLQLMVTRQPRRGRVWISVLTRMWPLSAELCIHASCMYIYCRSLSLWWQSHA